MSEIFCPRDTICRALPIREPMGTTLTFRFDTGTEGCVAAGGRRAKIENGRATLDLSALADGEYTVILYAAGRADPLGRYEKKGASMRDAAWDAERLFALADSVRDLTQKIEKMKQQIENLYQKIGFDFLMKL